MRYVGQQPSLAREKSLQAFGSVVEGAREVANLVAAPGLPTGREVAATEPLYRCGQIADRRYQPDRSAPAKNSRGSYYKQVVREVRPGARPNR